MMINSFVFDRFSIAQIPFFVKDPQSAVRNLLQYGRRCAIMLKNTKRGGYVRRKPRSSGCFPFSGYRWIGEGDVGEETGGSFVNVRDERYFICGNGFRLRSNYRIYSKSGRTDGSFDYPDGGFCGWGTVIPVKLGSRTRLFWMTFDRHNGSDYNWSYGNLYCYEAD